MTEVAIGSLALVILILLYVLVWAEPATVSDQRQQLGSLQTQVAVMQTPTVVVKCREGTTFVKCP